PKSIRTPLKRPRIRLPRRHPAFVMPAGAFILSLFRYRVRRPRRKIALELLIEREQPRVLDSIDVQRAVEVIELVLEHGCKKARKLELVRLPGEIRVAHANVLRPLDV